MKTRIAIKRTIDVLMFSLFVYLMNYHVFGNLAVHAWGGITLFALFVAHNILNIKWWRTLCKRNSRRNALAVTNIALFVLMIAMAISSCMMSRAVFYSSPFPMSWKGKALHKLSTSWGFMVMAVHLSLHLQVALSVIEMRLFAQHSRAYHKAIYTICSATVVATGVFSFYHSGLWRAMFLIRGHGSSILPALAVTEYVLIVLAVTVITRAMQRNKRVAGQGLRGDL